MPLHWSGCAVSSPQMWMRLSQWPISWVAVRPRLKGAAAVPIVPKACVSTTKPSSAAGPPGKVAKPSRSSVKLATHMLR